MIVGIDEVGRGCFAGPVVACAVILPPNYVNENITDSKKLSSSKRISLDSQIRSIAYSIGIGVVCNKIIDQIGILNATKNAMHLAISKINKNYNSIIIDAVSLKNLNQPFISPIKADLDYIQVSAASIVAKVYRDNLMGTLHTYYNQYGWNTNMGYGTIKHINAIKQYGHCELHRLSFMKKYVK